MEPHSTSASPIDFHTLKIAKKQKLTKNTFALTLEIPKHLESDFQFQSGQYVVLRYKHKGKIHQADYSITTAPYEKKIALGIKINHPKSAAHSLFNNYHVGNFLEISLPKGRFTLVTKPHEFRTLLGFAAGIGITPIISHFKNILHTEPRSRLFLFYGNKSKEDTVYYDELMDLQSQFADRLQIHFFYSREKLGNSFTEGRLDEKKLALIINQILNLDDTDEESTIWDAVDEVLICGKGEMIKTLANACYNNGIPKKNIHFELFNTFDEDIYPIEKTIPSIQDIEVSFTLFSKHYKATLPDNRAKILQQLQIQKFPIPYSCKSGICGSCICQLEEGKVEIFENEYLTEEEEKNGKILPCMSIALSKKIMLNFDEF